ncbi:MAG: hypothetical protein ABSF46_22215 [Terriglobia bacterium]
MRTSLQVYREFWEKGEDASPQLPSDYPGWPESGVALLGDFAGIQSFVLRPVPGAGGAAKRLRSRSFRVSAYTELIWRWCVERLSSARARLLYSAGGRFLIGAERLADWQNVVRQMQKEIDLWAWSRFQGELAFHLVGAEFNSGKIPVSALMSALEERRSQPRAEVLAGDRAWDSTAFFRAAGPGERKCQACGVTDKVITTSDGEEICKSCDDDERRGLRLAHANFAHISEGGEGDLRAPGLSMSVHEGWTGEASGTWLSLGDHRKGAEPWHLLRHLPVDNTGRPLDFEEIANFCPGSRKWLGYLRIDVDGAGRHFRNLNGDPVRTWALSRLLHLFFAKNANDKLSDPRYKNIYAVYGGGDDLFVIGPWPDTLDFAADLRKSLVEVAGTSLAFSAGMALAKPRDHILTQAEFAHALLDEAKNKLSYGRGCGRNQINALGNIADWETFQGLLETGKKLTKWIQEREIPSSILHRILELHHGWKGTMALPPEKRRRNADRYRPLLYYQIQRNIKRGDARDWAQTLLSASSQWPWADFIARYAMLAREAEKGEGG